MIHDVDLTWDDKGRRWFQCSCGWRTEPSVYTEATAGVAAVRHVADLPTYGKGRPDGGPQMGSR